MMKLKKLSRSAKITGRTFNEDTIFTVSKYVKNIITDQLQRQKE